MFNWFKKKEAPAPKPTPTPKRTRTVRYSELRVETDSKQFTNCYHVSSWNSKLSKGDSLDEAYEGFIDWYLNKKDEEDFLMKARDGINPLKRSEIRGWSIRLIEEEEEIDWPEPEYMI